MKILWIVIVCLLITSVIPAQRVHIGLFGGVSAYNGDLVEKPFPKDGSHGAVGVSLNYEVSDRIMIRGGFTYGVVGGSDKYNKDPELVKRNLSFKTSITELSVIGEYYLQNLYERTYSPYIFGGLAVFRFNPYTYDQNNNQIFLKPLSTEGQGLPGYPNRKPYSLTQAAIPFGGGVKIALNDRIRIGLEVGLRKTFTDYLDDVSSLYADPNDLLAAKGQLAVDISYRGDELTGGEPQYPVKGWTRGGEKHKDIFYFTGLHLTYKLGASRGGGLFGKGRGKNGYGCPTVPL
ncbi:MAG: outer membrane beta-barrel protein [Chitinophagaceae bacterium]|nr:outer membrane beta-barrel protein [Chitinophagaceae bacterium]